MLVARDKFYFVERKVGITKEGEKYFCLNVLTKNDKSSMSFLTKEPDIVDNLSNIKFVDFQEIELIVGFKRVFNPQTRYSNWNCELIGIGNIK